MLKVKGLSHVVLYVNDLEKMVAFYTDVLGLVKYHENPGRMVFLLRICDRRSSDRACERAEDRPS